MSEKTASREGQWFDIGDQPRIVCSMVTVDGEPVTDPITGSIRIEDPNDTVNSWDDAFFVVVPGSGSEATNDLVPTLVYFPLQSPLNVSGVWSWEWTFTAPQVAVGSISSFLRCRIQRVGLSI